MDASQQYSIEVRNITKRFGNVEALRDVSFSVRPGTFHVLLGPSGGGKTTLLRIVGGFERPTTGSVSIMGRPVTHLPPDKRSTSMVFQGYALFPHMNVERNVGYGLRLRKVPAGEMRSRVDAMLELVGLQGYNRRMPHELSGGQQQRVQLARSLVLNMDILLLDEPLAALDAKLRKDMCLELKHIQEKVGITFLYVTHNQEEAMTIADRIAVIADGRLVEEATPEEIYQHPKAAFTADFIGENNLLPGRVVGQQGEEVAVNVGGSILRVPARGQDVARDAEVTVSIRSEKLRLLPATQAPAGLDSLEGTLAERVFLGLTTNYLVRLNDGRTILLRRMASDDAAGLENGSAVRVAWPRDEANLHTF